MRETTGKLSAERSSLDALLLTGYCGLIFWLSSQPRLPGPDLFPQQDKLIHAMAYALMALLAWQAGRHWLKTRSSMTLVTTIFCIVYGLSDEWHQSFVAGRDASPWDWLADTTGSLFMALWLGGYLTSKQTTR